MSLIPQASKRFRNIRPRGLLAIAVRTSLPAILITALIPMMLSCSDDGQQEAATEPAALKPESFTFFDLGINSRLDKKTRNELGNKLGRDAIEQRSIMDLEINYKGFLQKYFPKLNELNLDLNFPPGERVEHNTVKLMYRYALKKNVPFDYVELVFSNYTQAPLLFRINFRQDDAGIVDTLNSKYGQPRLIVWKEENGQSHYWTKTEDVLIVSQVPDQFGNPRYQIVIYFVKNLEQLIAINKVQALLQAHLDRRGQLDSDVSGRGTDVCLFLLFAYIDRQIVSTGIQSYNHSFIYRRAWFDEGYAPLLGIVQPVG